MALEQTDNKQVLVGRVVSDKMNKTVVVQIVRTVEHPRFHKIVKKTKKYHVHDEEGVAREGDIVEIYHGRPKSKMKYMYLSRVVRANAASAL